MGLKKFFENIKKKIEDRNKEETDPAVIKQKKKEAAEKTFKRTTKAIQIAKKGLETYNTVSKKAGEITDAAVEKTAELAEKVAPIAGKVDELAGKAADTAKGAFDVVKGTVIQGAEAAGKKIDEVKKDNEGKPSTGSGLLDLIAPAVPETEATKRTPKQPPAAPPAP